MDFKDVLYRGKRIGDMDRDELLETIEHLSYRWENPETMIEYSFDIKQDYWENVSESPEILSELIVNVLDTILGISDNTEITRRSVFKKFEISKKDRLCYNFEIYNTANDKQKEIYMSKLTKEDKESLIEWIDSGNSWPSKDT